MTSALQCLPRGQWSRLASRHRSLLSAGREGISKYQEPARHCRLPDITKPVRKVVWAPSYRSGNRWRGLVTCANLQRGLPGSGLPSAGACSLRGCAQTWARGSRMQQHLHPPPASNHCCGLRRECDLGTAQVFMGETGADLGNVGRVWLFLEHTH